MKIDGFFPIPVSYNKIPRDLNKNEIDFINNQRKNAISNTGNLVSFNKHILDTDELRDLKCILTKHINEYFKIVFEPEKNVELYITNSWLNWTENDEFHHIHNHPNSLISGVIYVETAPSDSINFFNPNDILGNINIKTIETGKWICEKWRCPVNKNHVLLFPSTLRHNVDQRCWSRDGTRISLAFNTWFKGFIGDPSGANMLEHNLSR